MELKRQYEAARIEEVGTIPVLKVLSPPTPPLRRASPKRVVICLTSLLFGLIAAGVYIKSVSTDGS